MAKLLRLNKLNLTGLYFRCLGVFDLLNSKKTSIRSRESFSSVIIHQAGSGSLSQQEEELSLCPISGWSGTSLSTEVFLEQPG